MRCKGKNRIIQVILLLLLAAPIGVICQCTLVFDQALADDAQTDFLIAVDGLVNQNLDNPNQGLCGVRVHFRHSQVGDLQIFVKSPSGQSIQLTGPQVVTTPTLGANFNITFLPCSENVTPDAGFADTWSNNQAWSLFGNYTGTYYPFAGCLEDLTGPANGLWELNIIDAQGQDVGELVEVELIFCDPAGLTCSQCQADGGRLPIDTIFHCTSADSLYFDFDPRFGRILDSTVYAHFYVISKGDRIVNVVDEVYSGRLDTGIYQVCGISVLNIDTNFIQSYPFNSTTASYEEWLRSAEICYNIGNECTILDIRPELPAVFNLEVICAGDTLYWRGAPYTTAGAYNVRQEGENGCLRDFNLALTVLNPTPVIRVVDSFGCSDDEARLAASDPTAPGATFSWYTSGGSIVSGQSSDEITIGSSGEYFLVSTVRQGGATCRDTASVRVENDFDEPQVSFLGDTFSCIVDSIYVRSFTNVSGATIIWRDQSGQEDTVRNHPVLFGEQYELIAISAQGCRDSVQVSIPYDTIPPEVTLTDIDKICRDDTVRIAPDVILASMSYSWRGPDGNIVMANEIFSADNGTYILSTTAENGCTAQDTLQVRFVGPAPQFAIDADTFFCLTDSIHVVFSSGLTDSIVEIVGSTFYSNETDVFLDEQGQYTFSVLTTDGCFYDSIWQTTHVVDISNLSIDTDTIDCAHDTVVLISEYAGQHIEHSWSGPGSFTSTRDSIAVTQPGEYRLQVITRAGCVITGQTEVVVDTSAPDVDISLLDQIDCAHDSVQFDVIQHDGVYDFDWRGPNGFESMDMEPWATETGNYFVTVTNANGCIDSFSFIVQGDFDRPTIDVSTTIITCDNDSSQVDLTTDGINIEWTSVGYQTSEEDPKLPRVDTFHLYVQGSNGCDTSLTITPMADTTSADLTLSTEVIGCLRPTVPVTFEANQTHVSIEWQGPDVVNPSVDTLQVSVPGFYTLYHTSANGCLSVDSIEVIEDLTIPDVSISGTVAVNCLIDTVRLSATSMQSGLDYTWVLPDNSIRSDSAIVSLLPGQYLLVAEAANTCRDTIAYTVLDETALPTISLSADTINCSQGEANVEVVLSVDDIVTWTFPDNSTTMLPSFETSIPGTYKAVVTNQLTHCVDSAQIEVHIDTATIENMITADSFITCARDSVIIFSNLTSEQASLNWSGPGLMAEGVDEIIVNEPGMYYLLSVASSLCSDLDSIFIGLDTVPPSLTTFGDTIRCDQPDIPLGFTSDVPSIDYVWNGPDGFIGNDSIEIIDIPGEYVVYVRNTVNGCVSTDTVQIMADTLKPDLSVETALMTCTDSMANAVTTSMSDGIEFTWQGPNMFMDTGAVVSLPGPGEYLLSAIANNGCVTLDTISLTAFDLVDSVILEIDTIRCNHPMAIHLVSVEDDRLSYTWRQNGMEVSNADTCATANGRPIKIELVNESGCQWDATFSTPLDTVAPVPVILAEGQIICEQDSMFLLASNIVPESVEIVWSTIDGLIASDVTRPRLEISAYGTYDLIVRDSKTGCLGSDTITLQDTLQPLEIDSLLIEQLNCSNQYEGSIEVLNVMHANGFLQYSLNGQLQGSSTYYPMLSAGTYDIVAIDALGCRDSVSIVIDPVLIRQVDIERDTVIPVGASLYVPTSLNFTSSEIVEKYWTINGNPFCFGCDSLELQVLESGYYAVFMEDDDGCIVSDSILVEVIRTPIMYIPNAFSPNDDGINDVFGPFLGENIARVRSFQIFSRWGSQVFARQDVSSDDLSLFWDGASDGKAFDPGLFIYQIELELVDGTVVQRAGEVHLIR